MQQLIPPQGRTTKTPGKRVDVPAEGSELIDETSGSPQEMSDRALIAAICLGLEWAIETLYLRYNRYVYALAYSVLHESRSAEEIVQEVFVSIWRHASLYQPQKGSVSGWLMAIGYHSAIDAVRSASHRDDNWISLEEEEVATIPGLRGEVWEETWQQEQRRIVCASLALLPVEQREVIELTYFQGVTYAAIAERKQLPLGTIKGRMRLGLLKMKRLLQAQGLDSAW